ncbi:MAG: FkbM family methyltransferase [Rhodobacterales bacterium]|nr:MAG: FkbM family methyltransferase [Rhodobacterales bacterium]
MDGPVEAKPKFIRSRGLRIPNDPQFIRPKVRRALRENNYEAKECDAILRAVNDGDTVMDLGAGIGYVSTLVARKRKLRAIHSFEANPLLIDFIRRVHAVNEIENATVHNTVLAPRKGKPVEFYVRSNFLASSLNKDSAPDIISTHQIETAGINTVMKEIKPDVLICDIEGAEADLFPAIRYTRLRAAIVELHPQWIGQKGVQAVFDAMHNVGLTYYPRWSNAKVVAFRKGW